MLERDKFIFSLFLLLNGLEGIDELNLSIPFGPFTNLLSNTHCICDFLHATKNVITVEFIIKDSWYYGLDTTLFLVFWSAIFIWLVLQFDAMSLEKVNKLHIRLIWCCVVLRTNIRFAPIGPQTTHPWNFSCNIINFSLWIFIYAAQLSFWLCCVLMFKFNLSIFCCWRESEYWISIPNQISAILSDFAVWASQFNLKKLRGVLQCDLHFLLLLVRISECSFKVNENKDEG